MNEAVQAALPEKDVRGTFDWWAAKCRTYTGRSLCDSGGAYGYAYERPVREEALLVDIHRGHVSYFSISTPYFLNELLDAGNPIAEATEELLHWLADNVLAKDYWPSITEGFYIILNKLLGFANTWLDEEYAMREEYLADIEGYLRGLSRTSHYTGLYSQTADGIAPDWEETFPFESLETIGEVNGRGDVSRSYLGGRNTYNGECDLDQTLQFNTLGIGGQEYILLQIHCGCDIRGGYTSPIVARMRDPDYFYFFTVSLWCNHPGCDAQYELSYFYNEALDKLDLDRTPVLVEIAENSYVHTEESGTLPVSKVSLLCSKCGNYTVHPWTVAEGY
jgi:hypothetical protein